MNYAPGGTIVTWEVTPSDRRITGTTDNGKAQRDSIARQYGQDRNITAAA